MIVNSGLPHRAACLLVLLLASCSGARANSPYGAFMAGRYAASIGDQAAAARYFGVALADDPGNTTLLREGFIASLLGNSSTAPAIAAKLGKNPLALLVRANAAIEGKDPAKAARLFASLPPDGVTGLIRPLLLAWAEAGTGSYDTAIDRLINARTTPAFGPVYILNAAMIADLAGREAEAARLYQAAGQAFPTPNLRLAQALASFQARQGNAERADAVLTRMAAAHPDLRIALRALEANAAKPVIDSAHAGIAEAYLTLAGSLEQPRQAPLRRILLGFALDLNPHLSAARMLLAQIDIDRHKPERATAALAAITPADPLYGPALLLRAQSLDEQGKGTTLLPALAALAAAHPHATTPLTVAADIEREAGHFPAAIKLYTTALARLGPNPPESAWGTYYARAIAEDKANDWPNAEADLHRALALEPGQPYVLNYLAYSYALHGEHLAAAQHMLQQALAVDPNEGAIIDSLGYVLMREGKIRQALRIQIEAVHRMPEDPLVNAHLADIFAAAGDHLAARNQWARALALHPDAKEKARIEARLKHADDAIGS